ncbi:Mitochondrial calcium uniporter regulator 1 protein [Dioscorea alata]|uniref:Mitochondrial calcium uniporter regulator 1 protein n=2 Tax=Dioscorea alata TaxID=55571 RepID=A0ACB7WGK0_DIOAL|nr:Mitochondrial calcium uniporter regulator 1 protein [Dioscorea alata]KAH7686931.1 Mitochondrial calcium uniporter regulator 1 protein [Dioscorea alata]
MKRSLKFLGFHFTIRDPGEHTSNSECWAYQSVFLSVLSLLSVQSLNNIKEDMQKSQLLQDANLSKFKWHVQSSQNSYQSIFYGRYEIGKVTAGQRLDLNQGRGHIRDELCKQHWGTMALTTKNNSSYMHL